MTFTFTRKTDNVDDVMAEDINELQSAIESLSQLSGGINLQGDHDASTKAYPADPSAGDLYVISVAGTIDGTTYAVGDLIVYDGDEWIKIALSLDINISGTLTYKGVWDASTEAYPEDPSIGDYYIINVAGTIEGTAYVVGDIITYDTGGNWAQTELGVEVVQDIDDLGDVDTTGVSDGDALVYDSAESEWVPGRPDLDDLNDVDTTGVSDGDALVYDSAESEWVAEAIVKPILSNVEVFTSSGTWTKPAGLHHVVVEVVGGGGGGGAAEGTTGQIASGGGGGGGGFSKKFIEADDLGSKETVTVGAGGAGGTAPSNNGTSGGTSSFGAHCSATGGNGGTGQAANAIVPRRGSPSGAGGAGSSGDINANGHGGVVGANLAIAASGVTSGGGGGSIYGDGGQQKTSGAGNNGAGYGAGGGGACQVNNATDYAGGNGTDGLVVVWEYVEG